MSFWGLIFGLVILGMLGAMVGVFAAPFLIGRLKTRKRFKRENRHKVIRQQRLLSDE